MAQRFESVWVRYIGLASLALPALVTATGAAYGSGFALREQSGSAMGNAFAGATAGAEDIRAPLKIRHWLKVG